MSSTLKLNHKIQNLMKVTGGYKYPTDYIFLRHGEVIATDGTILVRLAVDYDGEAVLFKVRGPAFKKAFKKKEAESVLVDFSDFKEWPDERKAFLTDRGTPIAIDVSGDVEDYPDVDYVIKDLPRKDLRRVHYNPGVLGRAAAALGEGCDTSSFINLDVPPSPLDPAFVTGRRHAEGDYAIVMPMRID